RTRGLRPADHHPGGPGGQDRVPRREPSHGIHKGADVKVPDLLGARAELSPGATALADTLTGREFDYATASDRAGRTAHYLRDGLGVRRGDRVAVLSGN